MKIWHFSDTHTYHGMLKPPDDIDIAIFSGDCSNPRDKYSNEQEVLNFLCWYGMEVKAKYRIFVAGNHDTSIEAGFIPEAKFKEHGIIYLENSSVTLNLNNNFGEGRNINIWGSPITPSFGFGWAFNKKRDKLHDLWQTIPEDTDIVISHGPPKGILDLAFKYYGKEEEGRYYGNVMEFCGCKALLDRCETIKPKLVLFGHIHNNNGIINAGYRTMENNPTIYSNGSVVTDGKFGLLSSNGNIFDI